MRPISREDVVAALVVLALGAPLAFHAGERIRGR
jgi:hypothetical protein